MPPTFALPLPQSYGQTQTAPSGDVVARLMTVHSLASATADAVLLGQALPPQEQAALLQLWPSLLQLTAAAAHSTAGATTPSTPFAAAANVVLAQRGEEPQPPAACLVFPQPYALEPHTCATALHFALAALPADAAAHAELQVFAQQVNRAIEQVRLQRSTHFAARPLCCIWSPPPRCNTMAAAAPQLLFVPVLRHFQLPTLPLLCPQTSLALRPPLARPAVQQRGA